MKVILASHGQLASGLKSSIEIILGQQEHLYALDMYIDEETLEEKVQSILARTDKDEKVTVLTDVFGGSVNQKMIKLFDLNKVNILTGMNLPMLLELLTANLDELDSTKINRIIASTKDQVIYVNDYLATDDDEDDFLD
ncbi:PTS sugar transporter subunit IIA [Vagococcus silagei]|uniref:PTS N-acetylglucosamine transporter subunit IIBC n=1 Tax=Vagococcus silagei TaxID=2508885 RepID=A0A4S3B021_9ENTE|nr:PTS N-acetylglucosamine transporter subunit IIBC [Vagococcus silagei]THB60351.1 PTS N-acetylglucosamine transporter subunit IIBC [Vagococcus silagei]